MRRDLLWLIDTIPSATGVRFVDKGIWEDEAADMVFWTDTSLRGALLFVTAGNRWVYKLCEPPPGMKIDIFFLGTLRYSLCRRLCGCPPSSPSKAPHLD